MSRRQIHRESEVRERCGVTDNGHGALGVVQRQWVLALFVNMVKY